jgi:hypothetical protein
MARNTLEAAPRRQHQDGRVADELQSAVGSHHPCRPECGRGCRGRAGDRPGPREEAQALVAASHLEWSVRAAALAVIGAEMGAQATERARVASPRPPVSSARGPRRQNAGGPASPPEPPRIAGEARGRADPRAVGPHRSGRPPSPSHCLPGREATGDRGSERQGDAALPVADAAIRPPHVAARRTAPAPRTDALEPSDRRRSAPRNVCDRTTGAEQMESYLADLASEVIGKAAWRRVVRPPGGPGESPPGIRGQKIAPAVGLARRGRPVAYRPGARRQLRQPPASRQGWKSDHSNCHGPVTF